MFSIFKFFSYELKNEIYIKNIFQTPFPGGFENRFSPVNDGSYFNSI